MKRLLLSMVILCVSGGVGLGEGSEPTVDGSADLAEYVVPPPVVGEKDGSSDLGTENGLIVPGANDGSPGAGSDGALAVTSANLVIDLRLAASGPGITWDSPAPVPGNGVYDPDKWAVVFKYTSVNIASSRTVTFINHPSGAPVVWLVQGDVTIAGTVALNGESQTGSQARPATPGPGAFRGGAARQGQTAGSAGFGPGGATYRTNYAGSGGSYSDRGASAYTPSLAGLLYGNEGVVPLIGGSGGSPQTAENDRGGGAGGGAILIASPGAIDLGGQIQAIGGSGAVHGGGGSGGAIRLICDLLVGGTGGRLFAYGGATGGGSGGAGGQGRIRVEANEITFQHPGNPSYSASFPGEVARIWPESGTPSLRPAMLGGQSIPADPSAQLQFPHQDMTFDTPAPVTLVLEAENVPLDWEVKVRVVPKHGANFDMTYPATYVSGDESFSTWEAQIPALPFGFSAIQARASKP